MLLIVPTLHLIICSAYLISLSPTLNLKVKYEEQTPIHQVTTEKLDVNFRFDFNCTRYTHLIDQREIGVIFLVNG